MPANQPLRYAITGAPGAGNSTLLAELARCGVPTRPEVARAILREPGGMDLRRDDPAGFAQAMFTAEAAGWELAEPLLVCDRGLPDIVGFLELERLTVPAQLDRACRELRYAGPIFHAPPWREIYTQDQERIQSWEDAVASDAAVCAAWRRYGYMLVDLPLTSLDKRVDFVLTMLGMNSVNT